MMLLRGLSSFYGAATLHPPLFFDVFSIEDKNYMEHGIHLCFAHSSGRGQEERNIMMKALF